MGAMKEYFTLYGDNSPPQTLPSCPVGEVEQQQPIDYTRRQSVNLNYFYELIAIALTLSVDGFMCQFACIQVSDCINFGDK